MKQKIYDNTQNCIYCSDYTVSIEACYKATFQRNRMETVVNSNNWTITRLKLALYDKYFPSISVVAGPVWNTVPPENRVARQKHTI